MRLHLSNIGVVLLKMRVNKKQTDAQWQEGSQYLWHSINCMKCVGKNAGWQEGLLVA